MIETYAARLTLAGYRQRTITDRIRCINAFTADLRPPSTVSTATREDVERFLARPLSSASRRCYRSHLKAFYGWLLDEGRISEDPTVKIPAIRVPHGTPRPIALGDLERALLLADPRMRAWLLLMSLGGLRCIEVSGLRPSDILRTENATLLYLRECKGGGSASLPAHPAIVGALGVLPVRNKLWWTVSPASVSQAVRLFLRGIGVDATAHQLRHWAGSSWYRASGHDLLTTAELLRHANVQSSTIYTQTDPTRPAEVVSLVAVPLQGELVRV